MTRRIAVSLLITLLAVGPAAAEKVEAWPWTAKTPPDPALTTLSKITALTASTESDIVKISVKAVAPQAGFTDLTLTARRGDPNDRIFGFDARGRPPQVADKADTEVDIEAAFSGAPLGKFDTIEVYGDKNCLGYSLVHHLQVACSGAAPAVTPPQTQP